MKREIEEKFKNDHETLKKSYDDAVVKHRNEVGMIKLRLESEFDEERTALKSNLADALTNQGCNLDKENMLLEKLSEMEVASKNDLENFDLRVKEVRQEHAAQIDEMLAQLDLVEAEHSQRYSAIEKSLIERTPLFRLLDHTSRSPTSTSPVGIGI
jgi:DNA-binding transcriptional MerR regulator